MFLKKKIIINLIYYFFILALFAILSIELSNYFNLNRHWTSNTDHEFTLAYNALLFNSFLKFEFIDHSGYFTVIFLSFFIKVLNLIDLIQFSNLEEFLSKPDFNESSQTLIYYTRIYSGLCVALICLVINYFFNKLSKDRFFSLYLTIIFFISSGTIIHTSALRTELFATLFFILSLILINEFIQNNKENNNKYTLFLFFIFLYCAVFNKAQIFFYIPLILFLFYFNSTSIKEIKLNYLSFLKRKRILILFFGIAFLYIIIKSILFRINPLSLMFLIIIILSFNVFFYKLIKKSYLNVYENILNINLILVSAFIIFKIVLKIHPSANEFAFKNTFFDIINNAKYSTFSTIEFSLSSFISEFFSKFFIILKYNFSSINFNSAVILSILILFIFSYYKNENLPKKKLIFSIISIVTYFLINFINSFRGLFNHYQIFSQFFLLIPLCVIYNNSNTSLKKILIYLILIFPIYIGQKDIEIIKNNLIDDRINWICDKNQTYFEDWHVKLPKVKLINDVCKN
jgi:hypothetical protein